MQYTVLEPLRWQDRPARISVEEADGRLNAYYQITVPWQVSRMCLGRPVEEIPRILPILSPAHHIVSAMTLDRLFQVEPPPLAVNMRQALLLTQYFVHHMRKLYFLFCSQIDPFREYHIRGGDGGKPFVSSKVLDAIMHGIALAEEAATILGGRPEHPVSVVPGGVGRFLKPPHYERLAEIAEQTLKRAMEAARAFRERFVNGSEISTGILELHLEPVASLALSRDMSHILVTDEAGNEKSAIPPESVFETVGLHFEPWTYQPFAYFLEKDWKGPEEGMERFFVVGSLARLNTGRPYDHSLAETERQLLLSTLGSPPHFSLMSAFWSLVTELIDSAESMKEQFTREKLTGPAIRSVPVTMGERGFASMESPEGFIAHRYEVNDQGLVQSIQVLDTASENNAVRCAIARTVIEASRTGALEGDRTKAMIEVSLLPF